jgi:hypothetical protein
MDARAREYDRFGPWAIEISDDDPPPPLFEPHLTRSAPMLLAVKIPRHVERRSARPGMDLYDYLVCLYEDDLVILERADHEVRTATCRYLDVQHLRVSRNLLDGHIRLSLPGRDYDLRYNTVSDTLMGRVVETIRERYDASERPTPPGSDVQAAKGEMSFCFERLLQAQQRKGLALLAAQGTVAVEARVSSLGRRYLVRAAAKRLLESLHLTDGRELTILSRGQDYAYRWDSVYGVATSYIPTRNLQAVDWHVDVANGAMNLELRTGGGRSRFAFSDDNPGLDRYAASLAALASLPRSGVPVPGGMATGPSALGTRSP